MRRLFVLRPQPGAAQTMARAEAMRLEAVATPLFAIEPIAWDAPDPAQFDALLLTSANAVRQAGEQLALMRELPVHAIGEATATAAREAGFGIASVGSSEINALLAAIPSDQRLLHLCGEHRRKPHHLRHHVTAIPVYRSRALDSPVGLDSLAGQVAAVHSPRAAERLRQLVPLQERSGIRIAAISIAAAHAAGEGWERIEAAAKPDDQQLLALAALLCEKPDPQ